MFSYLLLLCSSLIFIYPNRKEIKDYSSYSIIFGALIFAQFLLGFISLLTIHSGHSNFPIVIISIFILLISIIKDKNSLDKFYEIKNFLIFEFNYFIQKNRTSKTRNLIFYFLISILFLIFISSIGPINHPDAADYHVGYPYQYFLRGGFFIDGGNHQALLGLSDYANLAFIQEKTVWLIRPIQIINLPFIVLFLSKKIKNTILIISFLSVPTFIQWSTIGKPLFLGESSLIILYLIWCNRKTIYSLKLVVLGGICCISFKISSLLIILPIFINYLLNISSQNDFKRNLFRDIRYVILSKEFLLSIFILFSLLLNRYIVSENFTYPFLTRIFNKDDILVNQFSNLLSDYGRSNFFFLKIFIPKNISNLATSFGPNIFFLTIAVFTKLLKPKALKDEIFLVAFGQLILLFLFCQGRSDYYVGPLILIIYQANEIKSVFSNLKIRYLFLSSIFIQLFVFSMVLSFSIFLNFLTAKNYSKVMSETAYGYNFSENIDKSISGNILFIARNTRFFYPKNYVDFDQFTKCLINNKNLDLSEYSEKCLKEYKINQVIDTRNSSFINEKKYVCETIKNFYPSRNFIFRKEFDYKYCRKISLYK